MPAKSKKTDDPDQHKRFLEAARKAEADESPDALDKVMKRVISTDSKKSDVKHPR